MSEMTLGKVHADMSRYLREDCYCPGEIYDITGFFFQNYTPESACLVVAQNDERTAVVAKPWSYKNKRDNEEAKPQAIIFWHDDGESGRIVAAQRVDATENNIGILKTIVDGGKPDGRRLDEFEKGSTAKSLREVMGLCGLVIVD